MHSMKSFTLSALALVISPVFAIPPADYGFPEAPDDTQLSLTYQVNGTDQAVEAGILFGANVPAEAPTVAINESYAALNASYTGQYLLFMVDPDASYPENPLNRFIIHWWQEGLVRSNETGDVNSTSIGGTRLVNTTAARVDYRRPRPPTNSSAHRYIQYLFAQPANLQIPEAYSGYGNQNASRFPFEDFVDDADLGTPIAANYFFCSNQTAVPGTFVAAAGGEYPGGNGAMVTQGENLPTSTSGTSATSSASGSASSGTAEATTTGSESASGTGSSPSATFSGTGNSLKSGNAAFGMAVAIGASWIML